MELKQEQREIKKELTKRQKTALEKVRATEAKNKKIDKWEDLKTEALGNMPDERSFNIMNAYLESIPQEDVLDDNKLKGRLAHMTQHLINRS